MITVINMALKTYLVGTREPTIAKRLDRLYETQDFPEIHLRRRRNDECDENSIAVVYGKQSVIGYLPKDVSALVIEHFKSGREHELKAEIDDILASDPYLCIISMNIEVTDTETGKTFVEYKHGEWQVAPPPKHWWSDKDIIKTNKEGTPTPPKHPLQDEYIVRSSMPSLEEKTSNSMFNIIIGAIVIILAILAIVIFG